MSHADVSATQVLLLEELKQKLFQTEPLSQPHVLHYEPYNLS